MNIEIGTDRIVDTQDTLPVFACQIGVTRVGAHGRVKPRAANGRMVSVAGLDDTTGYLNRQAASTELELRPMVRPARRPAPLAFLVLVRFATAIVTRIQPHVTPVWLGLGRVLVAAVIGRPGRIYHAKQPWSSIWSDGLAPTW